MRTPNPLIATRTAAIVAPHPLRGRCGGLNRSGFENRAHKARNRPHVERNLKWYHVCRENEQVVFDYGQAHAEAFDLAEPFGWIREAIEEARRTSSETARTFGNGTMPWKPTWAPRASN